VTIDQVLKYYGNAKTAAAELGCEVHTVNQWKTKKHITRLWQAKIEILTNGKLRADK
jgi:hypothetical protein